jgi:hypothetical protein
MGIALAIAGALIIVLGGGTFGVVALDGYWEGVAANVGVGVGLIGPLFLFERAISGQLDRVDQSVAAAREESQAARREVERVAGATEASLAELSREVRGGLDRVRQQDSKLVEQVLDSVTQNSLVALFRRAQDLGAIDRLGVRFALAEDVPTWIRARAIERQVSETDRGWLVEFEAQHENGGPIGKATAVWSPEEPAAEPLIRIGEALQAAGMYPGDEVFDAARLLTDLAELLRRAIELRTAPTGDQQIRPIAEIVNDDWAITQMGLDSLRFDLSVESRELTRDPKPAWDRLESDTRLAGTEHQARLREAFDRAQAFHGQRSLVEFGETRGRIFGSGRHQSPPT